MKPTYPLDIVVLTSIAIMMLSITGVGAITFATMRLGGKLNLTGVLIIGGVLGAILIALFLFAFVL